MPKAACDWSKQPLGLVPDEVLADQLGVSIHTVKRQRHRAGIFHIDMGTGKRILNELSGGEALSAADLAEKLGKADTWIQKKLRELSDAGQVWRHKARRGYVYTLAGVKYRHLSPFNGSLQPTMKAADGEAGSLSGRSCDDPVVEPGCVSLIEYDTEDRSDAFYCRRKRHKVTLQHCVDLFGEVHAMHKTTTPCWECTQGAVNRLRHCFDIEPNPQRITDLLQVATESRGRGAAEARLTRALENEL